LIAFVMPRGLMDGYDRLRVRLKRARG